MRLKWSAVKVNEAMDEVEGQLALADSFLGEAVEKAEKAEKIAHLPQYLGQRIGSLIRHLERINDIKDSVDSVRNAIPDGAIKAEQEYARHGKREPLM